MSNTTESKSSQFDVHSIGLLGAALLGMAATATPALLLGLDGAANDMALGACGALALVGSGLVAAYGIIRSGH